MAVNWSALQAREVGAILAAYPADSNRCEICATKVRAIGLAVDPDAHCFSVRPVGRERFVVPKANLQGIRWYYHFTAHVQSHCVDALTSTQGALASSYLMTYWNYPDSLSLTIEEPTDVKE